MKQLTILLMSFILLLGCKNEKTKSEESKKQTKEISQTQIEKKVRTETADKDINEKVLQTRKEKPVEIEDGKINLFYKKVHNAPNFSFTVEANNGEISTVKFYTRGGKDIWEFNRTTEIEGAVMGSYMTDLNKDGFKEFFIKIKPTDDSGNLHLIGFSSNSGISISDIYIRGTKELKERNSDKITIDENNIIREFRANGENLAYKYKLIEGEAGYILEAIKITEPKEVLKTGYTFDNFHILENRVGIFSKGMTIADVYNVLPKEQIKKTVGYGEFVDDTYDDYEIYDSNGKKILVLTPLENGDMNSKINRISILDGRFKTTLKIGLNSTFGDFKEKYPTHNIEPTMDYIALDLSTINAIFVINKTALQEGWWNGNGIDKSKIPSKAKFDGITIWWE